MFVQDRNLLLFGIVSLLSFSIKFTFKLLNTQRLIANSRLCNTVFGINIF